MKWFEQKGIKEGDPYVIHWESEQIANKLSCQWQVEDEEEQN